MIKINQEKIVSSISREMLLDEVSLIRYSKTAPHRYKKYNIKKRNGGVRKIAQPTRVLKKIQRKIVSDYLSCFPVHKSAYAYNIGVGIKQNALIHSKNKYLLKMDFKDFFPSITPGILFDTISRHGVLLEDKDIRFLSGILFYKESKGADLSLSIGAPSSPAVSNLVMYFFDSLVFSYCNQRDISYSRYADDISFSTNEPSVLFGIPSVIYTLVEEEFGGKLSINYDKTVFSSKKHNRHITGVVINNEGNISIGRNKKRQLSAMVHQYSIGYLNDEDEIKSLRGRIEFANYIDPKVKGWLLRKYGDVIKNII